MASHPELKATAALVPHPLVLCGMPRTGTTLLYNLLACDPACRAPLLTEMIQPVPPLARSDTVGQMQRNIAAQGSSEMLKAFGLTDYQQDRLASHPLFANEEDLIILYQAGCQWFNSMLTPHDNDELLLCVDAPRSHWLLKTPFHGLYLDELMHHYPSASLIMTHRRLDDVLSSFCHLSTVYARPYFDSNTINTADNIQTVVKRTLHLMDTLIHRLVKFRRNHQDVSCFDVLYDDLLAQPINTVRRIYNHFDLAWSEEFEMAMLAWLHDNPQGKHGRHSYTLNDCGMILDDIELRYREYISMFLNSSHSSQTDCSIVKNTSPMMNSMELPSKD
ncbi:unnamed protein product [Rotaria sp. Silwood2]|nr:unnamed protein product [Rotaria sp. Silwood2]